jgi:hypothetical protein
MMRFALLCGLSFASLALADEVVFYRCTDASGELTLQNMECPKGSKQEKKVMQGVGTVPMGTTTAAPASAPAAPATEPVPEPQPAPTPAPTSTPAPQADAGIADSNRLPPPVLFQCTTHDKDSYITESAEPQSRCVALRTVGLDGNPQTGAGEACEVVKDQCARVGDAALCDAWKKRLGETEVAWRFARTENTEKNKAEHERVQRIVSESSCGL